ncbi:NAD(P)H-binding protein [Streptomyces parvulus]|uniref:NAD(P)H-binding protein n=1 Tax=Streptomyces parvulus TaxID=146923 RepID=UPI0037A258B5
MIVVTAASGAYGRLVVDRLLTRAPAGEIAAAVRTPGRVTDLAARGVQVRHCDYDDPDTLLTAFRGADRLLHVSSPELQPERRIAQHQAVVDAACATGVGLVVYTSFLDADSRAGGVTEAHYATERALGAAGIPHTLLRHPFYSEAFLNQGLRAAISTGELVDGTGGRGINTASRADLAEAAARVLTEDHHGGNAYDFTGSRWTYPELARALSEVCGTPVLRRERSQPAAGPMGWLEGLVRSGGLERQTGDLQTVLGRPPTSLHQAVTALFATPE